MSIVKIQSRHVLHKRANKQTKKFKNLLLEGRKISQHLKTQFSPLEINTSFLGGGSVYYLCDKITCVKTYYILVNNIMEKSVSKETSQVMIKEYVGVHVKVKVKATQVCPTLCNSMDYTDHGVPQARILEWIVFTFSRGSSQPRNRA